MTPIQGTLSCVFSVSPCFGGSQGWDDVQTPAFPAGSLQTAFPKKAMLEDCTVLFQKSGLPPTPPLQHCVACTAREEFVGRPVPWHGNCSERFWKDLARL